MPHCDEHGEFPRGATWLCRALWIYTTTGLFIVFIKYLLTSLLQNKDLAECCLRNSTLVSNGSQWTHLSHPRAISNLRAETATPLSPYTLQFLLCKRSPPVILYYSLHLFILSTPHTPQYCLYVSISLVLCPPARHMKTPGRKRLHLSCTLLYSAWHSVNIQKNEWLMQKTW